MNEEIKPVHCGCGGEATTGTIIYEGAIRLGIPQQYYVECQNCKTRTFRFDTESAAIRAWNRAMERKTGEWISVDSPTVNGRCSVCGYESVLYENDVYGEHYCPNCGAWLRLI